MKNEMESKNHLSVLVELFFPPDMFSFEPFMCLDIVLERSWVILVSDFFT